MAQRMFERVCSGVTTRFLRFAEMANQKKMRRRFTVHWTRPEYPSSHKSKAHKATPGNPAASASAVTLPSNLRCLPRNPGSRWENVESFDGFSGVFTALMITHTSASAGKGRYD